MSEYDWVECEDCGWVGIAESLVALTDDPDDLDFSYCPNCESANVHDIEEDE
jgi:hypothetical protein